MRIAIVDDVKGERICLNQIIFQYFKANKIRYDVSLELVEYDSGETFLEEYIPGNFHLVFLDIYMNHLTGIDVAKRISALDKNCSIIFITTSDEYQLEGYGVHAAGYILKPVSDHISLLYNAMNFCMDKLQPDNDGITVQSEFGELHFYYRDILYFECIERKLYIHLTKRTLLLNGKYSDYALLLLQVPRFLECYRNVIVNMDYIDTPLDNNFILKNNEKLPISRRKKSEVLEIYMRYFIYR